MFELFSEDRHRAPHRSSVPVLISTAAHVVVVGVVLAIPILYVSAELPRVPDMVAFVVSTAPSPPPPPPPPPPAPAATPSKPKAIAPVPTANPRAAPVEAPREIVEEMPVDAGSAEGVPGGVEGGVPGGVVGGVVGGLVSELPPPLPPPPPPPSPPPVARAPVRIGGELKAPALVERVEPEYPSMAVRAQVQGVVILEAVVDPHGRVENVRVLRSIPLLDKAAMTAVSRWRYSPLLLNGTPERFALTVTVSFSLAM